MPFRFFVSDVEQAVAFYKQLEFSVVEKYGPAMCIMENGRDIIWLAGPNSSAARELGPERLASALNLNRLALMVKSIDAVCESFQNSDIDFRGTLSFGPTGKQFVAHDPWNNPIELFENK
jgi:catechol 2,3-dioxygenase-like lactoylglutathione lyase family enzyme